MLLHEVSICAVNSFIKEVIMFSKKFIRIIALVFVFALVFTVAFARGNGEDEEEAVVNVYCFYKIEKRCAPTAMKVFLYANQ